MIKLLEKTRKYFDFLQGKKPVMDMEVESQAKGIFAQCKFAIVRRNGLDEGAARQVWD